MVITGTVEAVIFRNEENGYTVLYIDADDRLLTAVGIFPAVQEGESLTLVGELRTNPKYGEQLDVTEVRFNAPTNLNGIINYLASGLFEGVGEATALNIVEKFGLATLDIIENHPKRLTEVRGIGKKRASDISKSFEARREMQNSILFLQKHGIAMGQALRIYQAYKDETIRVISDNPYRLIEDVDGIGFIRADQIAEKLGIKRDSDFRIMAGITHMLLEGASRNGHTYLPEDELVLSTSKLIGMEDNDRIKGCLQVMLFNRKISLFNIRNEEGEIVVKAYALAINYNTENAIAGKLIKLIDGAKSIDIDLDKEIKNYQIQNKIELDSTQKEGIKKAINSGAMVITGGPGTGKTTIIKCILELLASRGLNVMLAAPTGRAAKRMSEATGIEAKTIHRLLGMEFREGKFSYKFDELNPLDADVLIVDEISMADIYIFNSMLKAMAEGARLILVGDKDQLQSVSAGNILSDIIESKIMPVVYLTEIYRQTSDSLIVFNAHRVNRGEMPIIDNKSVDFFVDNKDNYEEIVDAVISMVSYRLPRHFNIEPKDIQVLSPIKRGIAGVENLNKSLQNTLNPSGKELIVNGTVFRVGDKVMHAVNNYNLKWQRFVGYIEEGEGVFNGDIGYITEIRNKDMVVEFEDGKQAVYDREAQDELILAYAISVHKSQGSEFDAVILVLSNAPPMLLNRNLLYTAITRAKKLVIIVGSHHNINRMVQNNYTVKRYTLLKEFIWDNKRKIKFFLSP